ncbi:bactofilin family protein [Natrinema saccharevitans]|uniref:polymer-forming cytoskeletal protein n=1 Tax=Natrinema saccharevitans TaxID=301967 RepID=UPI001FE6A416|nr:polymer-forming cytoskeletal protein [Natrinema saccharevitans]
MTTVDGNDCPDDLERGDVLQIIGSETLVDTYELRGRFADHGCEVIDSDDFDDGSTIELDSGDSISCEMTDGGDRLDNGLQIDEGTTLMGEVNVTKTVELTTSGTNEIAGDITTQKGVDVKDGSVVDGTIKATKSVDVFKDSEVSGSIVADEDVLIDQDAIIDGEISLTGSGRSVEVEDATVDGDVHADDNDVTLKGDSGVIKGDVTGETVECKDNSEINGDITANTVNGC